MINIPNINDNECFKWRLVTYLPPGYHRAAGIRKVDLLFGDELDFEDIKHLGKTKDIPKIGKKEFYKHYCFLGYENRQSNCQKKCLSLLFTGFYVPKKY